MERNGCPLRSRDMGWPQAAGDGEEIQHRGIAWLKQGRDYRPARHAKTHIESVIAWPGNGVAPGQVHVGRSRKCA